MPSFLVKQGGLPRWLGGKESSCDAGDTEDMGLILELGRSPAEENHNPLHYSCLGNPTDRGKSQSYLSPLMGIVSVLDCLL